MICKFGLLDADIDGFPELFCVYDQGESGRRNCKLYSLKKETFCQTILEYEAHDELEGDTKYLIKEENGIKSMAVESNRVHSDWAKNRIVFEFVNQNENLICTRIMEEQWIHDYEKNPDGYDPIFLQINEKDVTLEEYQEAYNKFTQATTPAPFVYEDYSYNYVTVIDEKIQAENHDAFYKMYDEFLKLI